MAKISIAKMKKNFFGNFIFFMQKKRTFRLKLVGFAPHYPIDLAIPTGCYDLGVMKKLLRTWTVLPGPCKLRTADVEII